MDKMKRDAPEAKRGMHESCCRDDLFWIDREDILFSINERQEDKIQSVAIGNGATFPTFVNSAKPVPENWSWHGLLNWLSQYDTLDFFQSGDDGYYKNHQ